MGGRLDPAVAAVRHAVRDGLADVDPGTAVLVACSGGPDSTALASAAVFEGERAGWLVGAAIVDHGLQDRSAETARDVAGRLAAIGCDPIEVLTVAVGDTGGPEAAARASRYEALERLAADRDAVVLLGHTRDDQAESVLLGLARGSGTRSLAGMPPRRGRFRRPLLDVSREVTVKACAAEGLEVWSDPHNTDQRYARVRVRTRVLPLLEETLGPGVADALARTATLARDDADALDAMASRLLAEATATLATDAPGPTQRGAPILALDALEALDGLRALRSRVLRLAAVEAGSPRGELTAYHIGQLDRLVTAWQGQHQVMLPGGISARRIRSGDTSYIVFGPDPSQDSSPL